MNTPDSNPEERELDQERASGVNTAECEYGGGPLNPETLQCGADAHTHCPFCGGTVYDECSHLLASLNDEDGLVLEGPDLSQVPDDLSEWRIDELDQPTRERFLGDLAAIFDEFENLNDGGLWVQMELFQKLLGMLSTSGEHLEWDQSEGMLSGAGDNWYVQDPERVRDELGGLIDRLYEGLERIARFRDDEDSDE